ncbi:tRNA (5-methylaminomethyl-2-thiouridine)(34)-methyltransferase MnmD [Pseudaestuariivita rosea]|uniref:tRNA (5-methylaminomethyl-2-thiouridine)(34)-methyltransferase MnmD n=1 Tax=Pseudaestuariivita rosea TaxID=2763263 RepID=UPI001ABA4181|nr:tRNA (5-methylaminomethyl-2-thiouridine)(34)-methyltransferase MnmD [Pseudaestuariivita rosea]
MGQTANLEWRDGKTPVSQRFDDPYFSIHDGLAETRHVFLAGNDLPGRFRDGFAIAELGFGTGLNFLVTLDAWAGSGAQGRFHFTSFEAFPMGLDDMRKALAAFPAVSGWVDPLITALGTSVGPHDIGPAVLTIVEGDARKTLPEWGGAADAWYLDGFSPAKNPELWGPDLMAQVAGHTHPGGTAATYTAAGAVRRGLEDAGFEVTRVPGYGRKRHMTRARLA